MPRGRTITENQVEKIYEMHDAGHSINHIADVVGLKRWAVANRIKARGQSQPDVPPKSDSVAGGDEGNGSDEEGSQAQLGSVAVATKTPETKLSKALSSARASLIPEEASIITITPRRFETTSALLWQAKMVTEYEWHWPKLSMQDWLDTFLYYAFKQRGIILGGYVVMSKQQPRGKDGEEQEEYNGG